MIKEIVIDTSILSQKSKPCTFFELDIVQNRSIIKNMIDTAKANEPDCIGLAAIQINEPRRIILFKLDDEWLAMVNPTFTPVRSAGIRKYKEGCLSFPERMNSNRIEVRRFKKIKVTYNEVAGLQHKITLIANTEIMDAVIIQHEIDHLNGLLI